MLKPKYTLLKTALLVAMYQNIAIAEVITDGTTGAAGQLSGPNYQVTSDLGTISGNNLFHSFDTFNLSSSESATFSGPVSGPTINNVISRVTGGGVSTIDGSIISNVAGADFWFINPNGVVFGQNASISVPGSFYVSTADYILLGKGPDQFNAVPPPSEVFSSAAPSAFGFLTSNPAAISVSGSAAAQSSLFVAEGERFAIVAGDINLTGQDYDDPDLFKRVTNRIIANSGEIDLVAAASTGEVDFSGATVTDTLTAYGDITLDTYSLDASASQSITDAGTIYIKADQFVMISSSTVSSAMTVSSNVTDGGTGPLGAINIDVNDMSVSNSSIITDSAGISNGSDINITATNLTVGTNGAIATSSGGQAFGGNINITTTENTTVSGSGAKIQTSADIATAFAGDISITTNTLNVSSLGKIITSTALDNGTVGHLTIDATQSVSVDNGSIVSEMFGTGAAPNTMTISTGLLSLTNFGFISSNSYNSTLNLAAGIGSNIVLNANEIFMANFSGIVSETGDGNGGSITMNANNLNMNSGSIVASVGYGTGDAGDIAITLANELIMDTAQITSTSLAAGGNFFVVALDLIDMFDSQIQTNTADGSNSGNINMTSDFVSLNRSDISTAANTAGGDINISSGTFAMSVDSTLDRGSLAEVPNGLILLDALNQEIPDEVVVDAPIARLNVLLQQRCAAQTLEDRSSFVVGKMHPLTPSPDGYLQSDSLAYADQVSQPVQVTSLTPSLMSFAKCL